MGSFLSRFKNFIWPSEAAFYKGEEPYITVTGVDTTGNNSLKYSAVFSCCRVISETVATVPIFEYKKTNKNGDREKTNDTGFFDILHHKYNDEMSAYAATEASLYNLNLGGNSVFTRQKNVYGDTIGLVPHQWQNVNISRNRTTGKLVYKIRDYKGLSKEYTRQDVYHIAGPTVDGVTGMSPIEFGASSIELGAIYEKFGREFYKNGVLSSGVFEKPGVLTEEAYARLKSDLKSNYAGLLNTGTPMLLEDGMQFKPLQMKLVDAELLSSKKYQIEDVARFYRMPLHLIQHLEHATNNNIEQQSLEFVMYTMLPHFKRIEDAVNTQLVTKQQRDNGYYFEYNINALLRGDLKSMYEAFAQGRQWGWLSVNDIRRMLNMNSIPNGDTYLQPLNMVGAGEQPKNTEISANIAREISALIERSENAK
jgi:HK97 family phage portal protein